METRRAREKWSCRTIAKFAQFKVRRCNTGADSGPNQGKQDKC